MADLRSFSKKIRVTGDNVQSNATKLLRRVAVAVDRTVVLATPVDTGRARSNWQVTIGEAPDGTVPPYAPGKGQSTVGANTRQALAQGAKVIAGAKNGDTIHVTNNLDYIGRLNDGYSAQAPANFVSEAVNAGIREVTGGPGLTVTSSRD